MLTMKPSEPQVVYGHLAQRAVLVALGSTLGNSALWWLGEHLGGMTIGLAEVVIGSVIGVVLGTAALAVLGALTRRPRRTFVICSAVVLVLYAFGPVSAALAPYREGAALFNSTTLIATELMHLVSGLSMLFVFTKPQAKAR
jgi:hypothetical protein